MKDVRLVRAKRYVHESVLYEQRKVYTVKDPLAKHLLEQVTVRGMPLFDDVTGHESRQADAAKRKTGAKDTEQAVEV